MKVTAKPLRSMMYVPGNKEDWILKAPQYGADALIIDLEDSVPDEEKRSARDIVSRLVPQLAAEGHALFVRVNGMETGLTEKDISFAIQRGIYAIALPMTRGPEDVKTLDKMITIEEERKGLDSGTVLIDPGLETASGIRHAYEVGVSSPRVVHMGAGGGRGGDVARSIGYRWSREGMETLFIRSKVLLDSRAAGVPYPMTGLWQDIDDHEGLLGFARHSRDLGYSGMSVIHPSHVPIVNDVFSPTQEEIGEWKGIIDAMAEARELGGAAVSYRGGMVDIAHEKTALGMLAFSKKLGLL